MTRLHDAVVRDQFGPRADAYVQSAVHSGGPDLDALEALVRREAPRHAIDLGTGGGHVSYRFAPHANSVMAVDLSPDMVAAVASTASAKGLANIETRVAAAESLPFEDSAFDFLACRFSAHHWRDFEGGLREARRVLQSGATAVFIDVVSPGPAAFDTHLQAIELLRDPSHIRDYTVAQWEAGLARAGFLLRNVVIRRLRMDYQSWVERMHTPAPHREAIRSLQRQAARETATRFEIEPDGSFRLDSAQIEVCAA